MVPTRRRLLSVQPVADGGGSEHALIGMIRELTAAGWECHVAVPSPARLAAEYASAGATVHIVPMRHMTTSGGRSYWIGFALRWPGSIVALARLARKTGADVVHTNSLHSWYGWAAALLVRRPHVWHAREIVFQSAAALRVERWLTRHFATLVIAVSAAVAAQLHPDHLVVVVDGADPGRFDPSRAGRFRAAAGIADDVPLIGSVARIDTWKGFDGLLDAFPSIAANRPGAQLVVAGAPVPGKEDYAEGLRRRAATMPGVTWLGPRSDIPELMADLDVFVQVSTEPEPFGLVVVEALASGVPVVAGAAGGPLEILGPEAVHRDDPPVVVPADGPGPADGPVPARGPVPADGPVPVGRLVAPGEPAAIAEAVLELLPAGPSSTARRRTRVGRATGERRRFAALFEQVIGGQPEATSR